MAWFNPARAEATACCESRLSETPWPKTCCFAVKASKPKRRTVVSACPKTPAAIVSAALSSSTTPWLDASTFKASAIARLRAGSFCS